MLYTITVSFLWPFVCCTCHYKVITIAAMTKRSSQMMLWWLTFYMQCAITIASLSTEKRSSQITNARMLLHWLKCHVLYAISIALLLPFVCCMCHYKVKAIAATTKRSSKNTAHPPIRTCAKKNRAPFHQTLGLLFNQERGSKTLLPPTDAENNRNLLDKWNRFFPKDRIVSFFKLYGLFCKDSCSILRCVAVCCGMLQHVAVCCSVHAHTL